MGPPVRNPTEIDGQVRRHFESQDRQASLPVQSLRPRATMNPLELPALTEAFGGGGE